jgi:hypothetical protein
MGDELRVDRASIQTHADDTRANMASFRSSQEGVDRRQAHIINQMEGGVGSEQMDQTRAATRRHSADVDTNVNKLVNRTSENADEFISNVRSAANKSLKTID